MGRDVAPAPRIPVLEPRPAQIRILIVHGQLSVAAIFLNLVGHHDARYAASGNDDSQRPICCGRIFLSVSQLNATFFTFWCFWVRYEYLGLRGGYQVDCTSLEQEQRCRYYHSVRDEMGCRLSFSPLSFVLFYLQVFERDFL